MRTGVDLIEIGRFADVLAEHGDRFMQRVFTPAECERYAGRVGSLAARWAAKEAVAKALGTGIGVIGWREIEILSDEEGAPVLRLYGAAAARAVALGLTEWTVSLSHTHEHAVAFVVAG